jgi:AcrR family transcriptional regulator/DNA-binding MarR family transcriptional regulator
MATQPKSTQSSARPAQVVAQSARAQSVQSSARPARPAQSARPSASRTSRSRLARGQLIGIQRTRILVAAGQVACERGAGNVSVAQIVKRAGVSRRTFYEIFPDSESCVLDAIEDALERAGERALPAWRSASGWRERLRRGLIELLSLFDEEPVLARLLVVESLSAGSGALARRLEIVDALIDVLDQGQARAPSGARVERIGAEGAIGGVLAILFNRIGRPASSRRAPVRLIELTGALMGVLVLPYRGPAAARRELALPVPAASERGGGDSPFPTDSFKEAGMRLTYRTMRVLRTIARHPGLSNRRVGELAEISDQGQISKLLSRLERLGMIANQSEGRGRGEPNAWTLTAAGRQLTSSLRLQAEAVPTASGRRSLTPREGHDDVS